MYTYVLSYVYTYGCHPYTHRFTVGSDYMSNSDQHMYVHICMYIYVCPVYVGHAYCLNTSCSLLIHTPVTENTHPLATWIYNLNTSYILFILTVLPDSLTFHVAVK